MDFENVFFMLLISLKFRMVLRYAGEILQLRHIIKEQNKKLVGS